MTQEEKNKLYKYLCAALPYNIKVKYKELTLGIEYINIYNEICLEYPYNTYTVNIEEVKPYLRPMESMTKEEFEEFNNLLETSFYLFTDIKLLSLAQLEWLNKNHFDYMRLIDDDLAIDKT